MGILYDEGGVQLFGEGGEVLYDEAGPDNAGTATQPVEIPSVSWKYVLCEPAPSTVEFRELASAYGRVLTLRIDAPSTAQFSLNGRSDEAAQIADLATDLVVYRDGVKVFRGRIAVAADDVNATSHTTQFTATDYRGMCAYRKIGATGRTFTAVDQGQIAWTLISDSQAMTSGNWGIVDGIGQVSGTIRDRTYDPGKPLLEAITELGDVEGGFDWEISPDLSLDRWYPQRGVSNGVVLDYGGRVTGFSRLLSPGDFANFVIATGSQETSPVTAAAAGLATDVRGRWEYSQAFTSIIEQSTLQGKVNWLRDQAGELRPEIRVTLTVGRWGGLSDIGLGDTVKMGLRSGRLNTETFQRVVEIMCVPTDGAETITMGLVAAT